MNASVAQSAAAPSAAASPVAVRSAAALSVTDRFFSRVEGAFSGSAPSLPLAFARMALAVTVLFRTTDVGRGVIPFNHHTWMIGVEYGPNVDAGLAPVLESPLFPGLWLGPAGTWTLVWLRTLSAITLLLGIRVRASAAVLAVSGMWLMCADRYRYLHHVYLLFSIAALFALVPSGERLSLERLFSGRSGATRVPRWSLQLLRAYAAALYFAAGVAKLRPAWLSGQTLQELEKVTLIGGPTWNAAVERVGYAPLGVAVCLTELSLAPLLLIRRTRRYGVVLGLALHAGVVATMEVSTFSGQMVLLLALFLVADRSASLAGADHRARAYILARRERCAPGDA